MRTFIGIDLDEDARNELASLCEEIRNTVPTWTRERWVPRENLHLTMRFLGEFEPDSIGALVYALGSELAAHAPFDLPVLAPADPVPGAGRARMLWTRYDDPESRCARLAATVDDVLATFGIPPEERPFAPHITLVRTRRPKGFSSAHGFSGSVLTPMSVHELTLFSSVLKRSGPVYDRIDRIRLGTR
ncbi:MAG: RNA 2',3'-cyclic phosphodiesterase [Coriobacteriia bacterium]|nr:RNA 2',3'-cyclic phosphodiesterase [Coriobacteriia bacterium]